MQSGPDLLHCAAEPFGYRHMQKPVGGAASAGGVAVAAAPLAVQGAQQPSLVVAAPLLAPAPLVAALGPGVDKANLSSALLPKVGAGSLTPPSLLLGAVGKSARHALILPEQWGRRACWRGRGEAKRHACGALQGMADWCVLMRVQGRPNGASSWYRYHSKYRRFPLVPSQPVFYDGTAWTRDSLSPPPSAAYSGYSYPPPPPPQNTSSAASSGPAAAATAAAASSGSGAAPGISTGGGPGTNSSGSGGAGNSSGAGGSGGSGDGGSAVRLCRPLKCFWGMRGQRLAFRVAGAARTMSPMSVCCWDVWKRVLGFARDVTCVAVCQA